MKPFFLSIGKTAETSLTTLLSAFSCGAAMPVQALDILHVSSDESDIPAAAFAEDLNSAHHLFADDRLPFLFPSSFCFTRMVITLPPLSSVISHSSSEALISALRGKGIPLAYKTDREAVEWALASMKTPESDGLPEEWRHWTGRIERILRSGEEACAGILCDLSDPFSAGTAFYLIRELRRLLPHKLLRIYLIALCKTASPAAEDEIKRNQESILALTEQHLVSSPAPDFGDLSVDACWILGMPASLPANEDAWQILYLAAARVMGRICGSGKPVSSGLHTLQIPGIPTLKSLGDQATDFASFVLFASWVLSDILPSVRSFIRHPSAIRSLSPNSRYALLKKAFVAETDADQLSEKMDLLEVTLRRMLIEITRLIRGLPDALRLPEVSDPLWQKAVDACGRAVTVASEYDVMMKESEEAGILSLKPVHRVTLADTEEEKQQKHLSDLEKQLNDELEQRNAAFSEVGAFRARYALMDCRNKCEAALSSAEEKYHKLLSDHTADHLTVSAALRRTALLQAAVARCKTELADPQLFRVQSAAVSFSSGLSPYASSILSEKGCRSITALLEATEEQKEQAQKDLRACIADLFTEPLPSDIRGLSRKLNSSGAFPEKTDALAHLIRTASLICAEEIASLHFRSAGMAPDIPLLPDMYPESPPVVMSDLLRWIRNDLSTEEDQMAKRGILAFLLLRQYRRPRPDEAIIAVSQLHQGDSPVSDFFLQTHHTNAVFVVSLKKDDQALPFALLLPGKDLIAAHMGSAHKEYLPSFCRPWWDDRTNRFRDPCGLLSHPDLQILRRQLAVMLEKESCAAYSTPLRNFLEAFLEDLSRSKAPSVLPDRLEIRLKAAYGLRLLPAFSRTLIRTVTLYEPFLPEDRIASALTGIPGFPAVSGIEDQDIVFFYRDTPFAREDPHTYLMSIPIPAEDYILSSLEKECGILENSSDQYHEALIRELQNLSERFPDAEKKAQDLLHSIVEKADSPIRDAITELLWPWDPCSPSIQSILTEALGAPLAEAAVQPFSDKLAVFPARGGEILGDALMNRICMLQPRVQEDPDQPPQEISADAVLPPLSPHFAEALCRIPEGKTLIRQELLSFEYTDQQEIRTVLTLYGSFSLRMIRIYSGDDVERLYSHMIPTLAVWPDLPLPAEEWKSYYSFVSMNPVFSMDVFTSDGPSLHSDDHCDPNSNRHVLRSDSFPLCFSFRKGENSIGALLNLLPEPVKKHEGAAIACIDFGSSATSVVLSAGHSRQPLQGPTMVRTLLGHSSLSQHLLRTEFIPAAPVSALLPTAVSVFRKDAGHDLLPLEDGMILMPAGLQDLLSSDPDRLYTALKWEAETEVEVSLCIHQMMLMTALQCRADGIEKLSWRFSLPDDMAASGREKLKSMFRLLADRVNQTAGYSSEDPEGAILFAPESTALGAYFRLCAPEDTRGGFMVLDLGACTADLSLFLRGREQAVRTMQLPLGIHYLLLPALLRNPEAMLQELMTVQDPAFLQDLSCLCTVLKNAAMNHSVLHQATMVADCFLEDHLQLLMPALLYHPATGLPTRLGAVLLLSFSYLMMLSGLNLLSIAVDSGKNDFLPEQMTLCIAGRGSMLLEALPPQIKTGLWHCLTMFRNPRVSSISLLFSAEKKLEIASGLSVVQNVSADLPPSSVVPSAISVRPEELLPQFILKFSREFPAASQVLFSGFLTGDFYHPFTPYGESVISAAVSQSFLVDNALRPFDALSHWITALLELIEPNP